MFHMYHAILAVDHLLVTIGPAFVTNNAPLFEQNVNPRFILIQLHLSI